MCVCVRVCVCGGGGGSMDVYACVGGGCQGIGMDVGVKG